MSAPETPADAPDVGHPVRPMCAARWEWRTFEYDPELWQEALGIGRPMASGSFTSETYLLVPGTQAKVKLRSDQLEIKQLRATNAEGLQQWWPTLLAVFPLSPADLATMLSIWGSTAPDDIGSRTSPEALVPYLLHRVAGLRPLPVKKWRRSYQVEECTAERATILVQGEVLESMAFTHEDPTLLWRVLRSRKLDGVRNTSYPAALARHLGRDVAAKS